MKKQANTICNIINDICSQKEIKALIFVGCGRMNDFMVELIKKGLSFPKTCLLPFNPSLGLMEGTVLFGVESLK